MITKREKLQYIYVFLTDLVVLLLSTLLAWLVLHRGWYEWLGVERPES